MDPETYLSIFPAPYKLMIITIMYLWGSVWFIISNPWLAESFFPDLDEAHGDVNHPSDSVRQKKRRAAELLVRRMTNALNDLLHLVFGAGSIHTPTVHSAA